MVGGVSNLIVKLGRERGKRGICSETIGAARFIDLIVLVQRQLLERVVCSTLSNVVQHCNDIEQIGQYFKGVAIKHFRSAEICRSYLVVSVHSRAARNEELNLRKLVIRTEIFRHHIIVSPPVSGGNLLV